MNRRLIALTTPVSYMSTVPQDPFIFGPPGARVDESQHPAYVTYDYVDAWATINYKGYNSLGSSFRCSEWRIASAGPDGTMTYGSVHTFNASNGLSSRGDLVRTGPRTSYPCDNSLVGL